MRMLVVLGCLAGAVQAQTWNYQCPSGERFSVTISGTQAVLRMQGKQPLRLTAAPAASGVKYTDGYTVLWTKGPEALIQSGEVNLRECKGASSNAAQQMPGMFTYMADAASFTDCETGSRLPVAMEGAYVDLERSYLKLKPATGAPLYVTVQGKVENRPKMEGAGTIPTLIVEKFVSADQKGRCSDPPGELSGRWRLLSISGQAVALPKPPYLEFMSEESRLAGFGGCNHMMGRYTRRGGNLKFGMVGSTMMACTGDAMTIEGHFKKALEAAQSFEITGSSLTLKGAGGDTLAQFSRE